ncbi:MAG: hypothetical protein NUW00_01495 [Candidatus Kaiserbacteria bacterium]|nr:hypothetical protein [Candidatus Kaiserbacteria bacterium]
MLDFPIQNLFTTLIPTTYGGLEMEVLYIVKVAFGLTAMFIFVRVWEWISSVNVRIVSYADRIWGPVWLLLLVTSGAILLMSAQALLPKVEGFVLGLVCFGLSCIFYGFWQDALHEESS